MSFIYLYGLNIDIMCIVSTWMSYAYSNCLNMDVICLFVLFTHENCEHNFCVFNNAQHLYLNNTNFWNNRFRTYLERTYETYKCVMFVLSQPHFEGNVKSSLTFPKMGLGNPPGLLKVQSTISGVKKPCIEVFFISLERSWSVDVQNGLAWAIWTFSAQVMVKRRAESQIGSLTLDH